MCSNQFNWELNLELRPHLMMPLELDLYVLNLEGVQRPWLPLTTRSLMTLFKMSWRYTHHRQWLPRPQLSLTHIDLAKQSWRTHWHFCCGQIVGRALGHSFGRSHFCWCTPGLGRHWAVSGWRLSPFGSIYASLAHQSGTNPNVWSDQCYVGAQICTRLINSYLSWSSSTAVVTTLVLRWRWTTTGLARLWILLWYW